MNQPQVPEQYFDSSKRCVQDLRVGETGFVFMAEVLIDRERRMWVDERAGAHPEHGSLALYIQVRRDPDGIAVLLKKGQCLQRPSERVFNGTPEHHVPVIRIEEEP